MNANRRKLESSSQQRAFFRSSAFICENLCHLWTNKFMNRHGGLNSGSGCLASGENLNLATASDILR